MKFRTNRVYLLLVLLALLACIVNTNKLRSSNEELLAKKEGLANSLHNRDLFSINNKTLTAYKSETRNIGKLLNSTIIADKINKIKSILIDNTRLNSADPVIENKEDLYAIHNHKLLVDLDILNAEEVKIIIEYLYYLLSN